MDNAIKIEQSSAKSPLSDNTHNSHDCRIYTPEQHTLEHGVAIAELTHSMSKRTFSHGEECLHNPAQEQSYELVDNSDFEYLDDCVQSDACCVAEEHVQLGHVLIVGLDYVDQTFTKIDDQVYDCFHSFTEDSLDVIRRRRAKKATLNMKVLGDFRRSFARSSRNECSVLHSRITPVPPSA